MATKKTHSSSLTPAMRQYLEIKGRLGDAIVFFRMGDFYEMFFEDAVTASKVLGIALTARDRAKEIPMCGFPYHAATNYIKKLIHEGFSVAVCEQVEEPGSAKGLVRREVTRVVTPGTAIEDELLEPSDNNYIASVCIASGRYGLSYMDLSTGEFMVTEFTTPEALVDEIMGLRPMEALAPPPSEAGPDLQALLSGPGIGIKKISTLHEREFSASLNTRRLAEHFGTLGLEGFGCQGLTAGIGAAGALLAYIKETQHSKLPHIGKISPYETSDFMVMDYSTRRNLEILENTRQGTRSGTLLELLDKTTTAMGARLLRSWLLRPLKDLEAIRLRHSALDELVVEKGLREDTAGLLKGVYDLQRLSSRLSMGTASPRDLVALRDSLVKTSRLGEALSPLGSTLLAEIRKGIDAVPEAVDIISRAIVDSPPLHTRDGGVIREGYDSELDSLRATGSGGKDWIASLEREERRRTGINTLKVGYNKVFGYYIEVTRANLSSVPEDYVRKQTLVNAERFITEDLKRWEERILRAEERARALEASLYREVIETLKPMAARIRKTADLLARLDVLISLARTAAEYDYSRPEMNEEDSILIEGGRHPVVEASMDTGEFVSNDLSLDSSQEAIIILTGPNMAGKSTYLRQNALIVFLAQIGSFVPASRARIGLVDRIFTRVGAWDDLSRGQSTFMVEMNETANILNNATPRSLVILDEIGRGTSTFDGLSIAWAVVEYLHDHFASPPRTLFATHYHELTDLSLTKERVKNYNMAVKEWQGRVIFLRKVVAGQSSSSYGIHVARLAGLPEEVLDRAREILRNLEGGELTELGLPRLASSGRGTKRDAGEPEERGRAVNLLGTGLGARGDFKGEMGGKAGQRLPRGLPPGRGGTESRPPHEERLERILQGLRELEIEKTTPMEALNLLNELKKMIDGS